MYKQILFSIYLPGHVQSFTHFSPLPPKKCFLEARVLDSKCQVYVSGIVSEQVGARLML